MHSSPDTVGEGIMFSSCSSAAIVRTDTVTTISHERLEQSLWNLQGIFTSPYWWHE